MARYIDIINNLTTENKKLKQQNDALFENTIGLSALRFLKQKGLLGEFGIWLGEKINENF